ncbi:MAG: hypothetical protein JRH09_15600 [Deltaproteobacteria bacterium]|nr:hypothetical protein [Deltaproteobacteria bacterium]
MKYLSLNTVASFLIGLIFIFLPALSSARDSTGASEVCLKAKKDFLASELAWSSMNAELGAMRQELERLRGLRWEVKITLVVLEDAEQILKDKGSLSSAQRMTLNSRIPGRRGVINPNGTFTMPVIDKADLNIVEAGKRLTSLLDHTEKDMERTEKELEGKEKKSHELSRKVAVLEALVEKQCKAAGAQTTWAQGIPRNAGRDVYERFVEREQMRQEEVDARRRADLDRFYSYYPYPYPSRDYYGPYSSYPYSSGRNSGAMLIELTGVDPGHSCRRCYFFSSNWEKNRILDELRRAAHEHERIPCAGNLRDFRILEIFGSISRCNGRLY